MQHVEIIDRFGRKRRALEGEMPEDGETIHFPLTLMDAMTRVMADAMESNRLIRDGYGTPAGHRPGYAFGSNDAHLRDAATQAYEERCQRLQDAWRQRPAIHDDRNIDTGDLSQLRDVADEAWESKKIRLANAWRSRA